MKKIFGLITFSGFVLMIGAAGSADLVEATFLKTVLLEILGMAISMFGMSALAHYKKMMKKCRKTKKRRGAVSAKCPESALVACREGYLA